MESIIRKVLGLGLTMLLLTTLAVAGQAFPSEGARGGEGESPAKVTGVVFYQISDLGPSGGGPPALISIVRSDKGFALGPENETLPVRLQVEKVWGIDPSAVRRLLGENRTLGEIKEEIVGDGGGYIYRGNIRLGHAHYLLEDLNLTSEERNSTLMAVLMEPVWGAIPTGPEPSHQIAGTVSIVTRRLEDGSVIGVGTLMIIGGSRGGSYLILLDSSVGGGCGIESCPTFFGDMTVSEEMPMPGFGPSSSTRLGSGFQEPFLDIILAGPGLITVPSSWGLGYFGGPLEPDLLFMIPWDPRPGEQPRDDLFGRDFWADPMASRQPREMLKTAASEI